MNKRMILVFVAGWLLALFLPPTRLTGMLRGQKS